MKISKDQTIQAAFNQLWDYLEPECKNVTYKGRIEQTTRLLKYLHSKGIFTRDKPMPEEMPK